MGINEDFGNKAKNLAFMQSQGVNIPSWMGVSVSVFRSVISSKYCDIDKILSGIDYNSHTSVRTASNQIYTLIKSIDFPNNVAEDIKKFYQKIGSSFVSIRSSATVEDTSNLSCAGLFDTYLYVPKEEVIEKVKECWASLFSDRALIYFHKTNISVLLHAMGVVIQHMVDSYASGVLFQLNPNGSLDQMIITAGYGLGEGVVSGTVETDQYIVNRESRAVNQIIQCKSKKVVFNSKSQRGVIISDVSHNKRNSSVLNDTQLKKLIELSFKIEEVYSDYQDIEFTYAYDGSLYILQARPITALPPGNLYLYDRSNIRENYPGVSLPLTCSVVKRYYSENFKSTFRHLGFLKKDMKIMEKPLEGLIANVQGRLYYNMTNWYFMISQMPGNNKEKKQSFEHMIGSKDTPLKNNYKKISYRSKLNAFIIVKVSYVLWDWIFNRFKKKFFLIKNKNKRLQNSLESLQEAADLIYNINKRFWNIGDITCRNSLYVMALTNKLKVEINKIFKDDGEQLFNDLITGDDGLESVDPIIGLMELSSYLSSHPEIQNVLIERPFRLEVIESFDSDFYKMFMNYLSKYGNRSVLEMKLESQTYIQNPSALADLIILNTNKKNIPCDFGIQRKRNRIAAENKLNAHLKKMSILKKLQIKYLVNQTQKFVHKRETGRLIRTQIYGQLREIYNIVAQMLVDENVLSNDKDIFYLMDFEIEDILNGKNTIKDIQKYIEQRKKQWGTYMTLNPIDRLYLKGNIEDNTIPQVSDNLVDFEEGLSGLGCCGGIVVGKAAVVTHPDLNTDVYEKILVTKNTDPGWVFLLMAAKGIVIEQGNFLSHAAIIGRELGKPTIVNVDYATKVIKNDMLIEIDGSKGTIVRK